MHKKKISSLPTASANAWLPGYIEDYNRRFAVVSKDLSDAHLAYTGIPEELARTLQFR